MSTQISKLLTKTQLSNNDIEDLINLINVESANSVYRRCAEEFDFRIVDLNGEVYSTLNELAPIFGYDYSYNASQLLKKHGVDTISISSFLRSAISSIRTELSLSDKDYSTKFVDYRGFLTIAVEGEGTNCDKVREYLLAMEEKARTDTVIYQETGMDTKDFSEAGEYLDDPTVITMMESQRTMQEMIKLRVQQLKTEKRVDVLEDEVGNKLSVTDEQEHKLNTMRDKLVRLKCENGWESRKAFGWFYKTVKDRFHIGVFRGLAREKFPFVMDWIDQQIKDEQDKSAQIEMPGVTITLQS